MTESIAVSCPKCGRRNRVEIGHNFKCRSCSQVILWKDDFFYQGGYVDTSPVIEEVSEETSEDLGDLYEWEKEDE
jgi:DNA-directed RNA polymerase subunit RPC12/RpoP